VIDPLELANDIAGNTISLALPGVLWALLYLLAWEHGPFAKSVGFGRRTFWLLLPGALLGTLALLPVTPISNDWLAISFAGGLFPLLVATLTFSRFAPPAARSLAVYVGALVVEGVALLAIVIAVSSATLQLALVVTVAAAVPLAAGASGVASDRTMGVRVGAVLGLTSGALAITFAATTAIPGVGIVENFPTYLVAPLLVGVVAALTAEWVFPGAEGFAIPAAYVGGTFGVLIGADVLRQPPLYGAGTPAGLYAIGGAGVFDLVYLSGLLAFAAAYVTHLALGRGFSPVGVPMAEPTPTPIGRLGRAFTEGVDGHIDESLFDTAAASRESATLAHRLLGTPEGPPDRPWQGLPVPGWVVSDQANLDAVARSGTTDGREGFRAFLTARWLVLLGRELGVRRFGTVGARSLAFVIDLVVVTLPAALLWLYLVQSNPGSLGTVAANIPFNASIYGFAAVAFLYFALAETFGGRTVGKVLLGLSVRNRDLGTPKFAAALMRNASKLPTLTVVGVGLAIAILLLIKAGSAGVYSATGGLPVPVGVFDFFAAVAFVVAGVALLGAIGVLLIVLTSERQRFGDLVAGTWVVRTTPPATPAVRPAPVPPPPAPPPPGSGPSG
jgi:uncharacterized RDD family membrane protein YckC